MPTLYYFKDSFGNRGVVLATSASHALEQIRQYYRQAELSKSDFDNITANILPMTENVFLIGGNKVVTN